MAILYTLESALVHVICTQTQFDQSSTSESSSFNEHFQFFFFQTLPVQCQVIELLLKDCQPNMYTMLMVW